MANKENTSCDDKVFYGLRLPLDANHSNDIQLVFDNRKDVLDANKTHKGSRFKAFSTEEDAVLFSQQVVKPEMSCDTSKDNKNIEKSLCPFSGLHPRELSRLRKAIEADDYDVVNGLIWLNPRYLVSSGDTPAVLMESCRYNACHIAAKVNAHRVLQLILNTVSDQKFMKLLFPFDTNDVTVSRIDFLLDLYVNTPEKVCWETPLHFGCKFGSTQVVSILLRHPKCDSDKVNKSGRKPIDMICERKGDQNAKKEILNMFESQLFIPLFRDDFSAQIGEPFKGVMGDNRMSALAGPMSPQQAQQLFKTLKSPLKCTPFQRKIRLTDPRKGIERVARNLCKDMNINWTEFWPFLNTRIDLTSDEGLNQLEKHLRHIYYDLDSQSMRALETVKHSGDNDNRVLALSDDLNKLSLNSSNSSFSSVSIKDESNDTLNCVLKCETNENVFSEETHYDSDSNDSDDSFVSALSSPTFLFDYYVNGPKISNEDIDAALALQYIIDSDRCLEYDFIQNWFHRVVKEKAHRFECDSSAYSPISSTPCK